MFTEQEKQLLISLICFEQITMIKKKHENYKSDLYKELERLKIKIGEMSILDNFEDDGK